MKRMACWGMFVVGTIDNILYPILISRKLRLHTIVAFISLAGGIFVFGASGIILGPITLTASVYLMHIWRTKTICNKRR
jgi:predicted PurR-regulated permease PerM